MVSGALMGALFASGVLAFLTPLPLLVLVARRQRGAGAALLVVVGCSIAGLTLSRFAGVGAVLALVTFAAYGIMGWCLGEGIGRGWRQTPLIGIAAGAVTLGIGVLVGGLEVVAQIPLTDYVQTNLRYMADEWVRFRAEAGDAPEALDQFRTQSSALVTVVSQLLPAIYWATSLFGAVVNVAIGRRFLRSTERVTTVTGLVQWRAPFGIVWVLCGSGIAFFLDRYIVHAGWPAVVALNVGIGCAAVALLQGLAVMQWGLRRMPRWWRGICYCLGILFAATTAAALVVVGLLDHWVDFRRRMDRGQVPQ